MVTIQNKSDLINFIIKQHDYRSYLEIGVQRGDNFNKIEISYKESVDPDSLHLATYKMTSDKFFALCRYRHYDVVLIDGMHLWEYAMRDIQNSLKYLDPSYIVVHDCNPTTKPMQSRTRPPRPRPWTGDVWKAWVYLRTIRDDLNMFVVDMDYGCGIITSRHQELLKLEHKQLNWEAFEKNKKEWLNIKSVEYFVNFVRKCSGTA